MWLATIDANRVKPEARFKLVTYQREAKAALARHFFGDRSAAPTAGVAELLGAVVSLQKQLVDLSASVAAIGSRSTHTVAPWEAKSLSNRVTRAAKKMAELDQRKPASCRLSIRMEILGVAGWSGTGRTYWNMSPDAFGAAERALSLIEKRLSERETPKPPSRQLSLVAIKVPDSGAR